MARPRKADKGRRRDSRQRDSRQHDSRQQGDGRRAQREGQGAQSRTDAAAAADSASRVATRQARTRPLRQLLEGIGTPDAAPFKPDPFQLEALNALEREDVLVTAPTGSGKT
ncbi:MAG TPA: hypothetical protein VNZ44_06050, partial [Pyrinomonadaceae bacterium]|nr:hypothetical protein [Pyrinomonadaceae bacterium]